MSATSINASFSSGDHLGSIDALRGIAAFSVVLYHLTLIPQPNLQLPGWASLYVLSGGMGVTLFFVVSAFCLCLSMRRHQQESFPTRRFYARRIFRIVPLFYVLLIISLIGQKFLLKVTHPWSEVLLSVIFGFNFVPGRHEGIVWASWTLGVEMVFYLLFPLIFRYVNNCWRSLSFVVFTMLMGTVYSALSGRLPVPEAARESFVRYSFLRLLPIFAIGMLAFFLYERFIKESVRPRIWAFLLVGIALFLYEAMLRGYVPPRIDVIYWQGIIFSILLLGLTISPLELFVNRGTRFFGEISYSLYLNHPPLVFLLIPAYRAVYGVRTLSTLQFGACLLLTVALLTALSYCSYRFIERPGMRLGSRLIKLIR